jgi:hypothetical protein
MSRWGFGLLVLALLGVHAGLALSASRHKSTTNDEIAHLTGGHTFNIYGDYRVQPENGVLPQRWHALPLLFSRPSFPSLESSPWTQGLAYQLSYDFFYRSDNDPDQLLFVGRTMNTLWGWGVVVLISIAACRLWGPWPALFATALAALSPTLLAHSALATSDMAMTFFFIASPWAFWWQTHQRGWLPLIVSSVVLGLACVAKFSAVLLLPVLGALAFVRVVSGSPVTAPWGESDNRLSRIGSLLGTLLVHGFTAWLIIWAFFGFRYAMMSPDVPAGTMPLAWEHLLGTQPGWDRFITLLRKLQALPEAFLYGFSYVLAFSEARGAFLDGELSITGWPEFFPKTFLYKTSGAELLTLLLSGSVLLWVGFKSRQRLAQGTYLLLPWIGLFVIYWLFSLTSHLNIGHRHILPTYPLLFVLCGGFLAWILRSNQSLIIRRAGVVGAWFLVLAQGLTALGIHPHYLAYFNRLARGPEQGYQHLADSSLDWGRSARLKKVGRAPAKPGGPLLSRIFRHGRTHGLWPQRPDHRSTAHLQNRSTLDPFRGWKLCDQRHHVAACLSSKTSTLVRRKRTRLSTTPRHRPHHAANGR